MLWESDLPVEDIKRYSRQIILPKVKVHGQKKLANARALVVGLGGLGSPVLMYLATTGIKTIGIVDFDVVELHNLQRQVIHREDKIGKKKTESAREFIKALNSSVCVVEHKVVLDKSNVMDVIKDYDVVLDCCDSLTLRYVLNDACRILEKDFVCASVLRWDGQLCVITKQSACYRCIFPNMKTSAPSCASSGVLGPVCGVIGSMQATEAVKLILNKSDVCSEEQHKTDEQCLVGRVFIFNCFTSSFKVLEKNYKKCTVCLNKKMGDIKEAEPCAVETQKQSNSLPWQYIIAHISNFAVVDIRTNDQFAMFRVAGSFNMPEFEKHIDKIRNFNKPVVVSCYKGVSSRQAAKFLEEHGIEAYSADRGIEGFKDFVGFHGV